MQLKARVLPGARERVFGGQLAHAQDLQDEAPLVGVGQIRVVLQKAHELGPAVGVHVDQLRASEEQMHLARALLERGGGIVEGRGARAQHRDALAAQRVEVDCVPRVRVEPRGQRVA